MPPLGRLAFSPPNGSQLLESGLEVVVTGAGGWLGQATIEMLESSLGPHLASRVHLFASSRRTLELRSGTKLDVLPLTGLPHLSVGPHLVAHYAYATREHVSRLGTATYVARNEEITGLVAAHMERHPPVGALVLSSGAVYLGSDIETNPYGVLKERDEHLFLGMAAQADRSGRGPRVIVPRLFNLAGPFLNKLDYVLGSILRDIQVGGPIHLRATHPVVRSYIHVRDLVDLTFAALLGAGPLPETAFDTAGEGEIEVGDLAALAASVLGQSGLEIIRPPLGDEGTDRYVGDPTVINALADSYGIEMSSLAQQIEDTFFFLTSDT